MIIQSDLAIYVNKKQGKKRAIEGFEGFASSLDKKTKIN
jgi:hypothetical protein